MRKLLFSLFLGMFVSLNSFAQDLPQPSPKASVSQVIGLTQVEVTYSRPGVKGRTIFGDLVPYNEMWRTGANQATLVEFSTEVTIQGSKVPAGKYSLFTIPSEGEWTFILNKDTKLWGTNGYDQEKDVARFTAMAKEGTPVENMGFYFSELSENSGMLVLAWDKIRVGFSIEVNTDAQAEKNIAMALEKDANNFKVYRNAAGYYFAKGNNEKALELITKAAELDEKGWYTHWVNAEILYANGEKKKAKKEAKNALKLGEAAAKERGTEFKYRSMIEEGMKAW